MAIDRDEEYRKIYGFYPPKNPEHRYETSRVLSDEDGNLINQYCGCDGSRAFHEIYDYEGDPIEIYWNDVDQEFYDEDGLIVEGLAEWRN